MTSKLPFHPADILLPKNNPEKWAVVACDQYTSQPEYWAETERIVGSFPSALRISLPEVYLNAENTDERIKEINRTMTDYADGDVFEEYRDAMILVCRTLYDGRERWGIVGAIDLDAYSYKKGTKPLIRATEGTVLSRIPPRVRIRRDAPLEMPHVMLLIDDFEKTVIEPLARNAADLKKLYDFELMQDGGHLRGYLLGKEEQERICAALGELDKSENPMLFAVGDGNHSLATAKACAAEDAPAAARRALVEVVNIHSPALDFEPIYRVVFGVNPEELFAAAGAHFGKTGEKSLRLLAKEKELSLGVSGLAVGKVQQFIDEYLASHPGARVDYIHGEDVTRQLAKGEGAVGFLFDGIGKSELFPYVKQFGALPRKTFSMGEAHDKRFYMEARKIR